MSGDGDCSLPHDTTGLSAVCDCGISRSYSLTIFNDNRTILLYTISETVCSVTTIIKIYFDVTANLT